YKGAAETDHSETDAMLGTPTEVALDFYAQAGWAEMVNSVSFINGGWQNTDKKLLLSVPLCMQGSTLADVAHGVIRRATSTSSSPTCRPAT
ncbi:hypothetical protein, partial [Escherichia coli]|uniref:hypothetical protein n=1 Tax=Escherichia coli TaxID=562 RepID=UPI0005C54660